MKKNFHELNFFNAIENAEEKTQKLFLQKFLPQLDLPMH